MLLFASLAWVLAVPMDLDLPLGLHAMGDSLSKGVDTQTRMRYRDKQIKKSH